MPDFVLNFTGLCAFVRNGANMRVVLVNARDEKHETNDSHCAALLTPWDNWARSANERKPDFGFDGRISGQYPSKSMVAFIFEGEDLNLGIPGDALKFNDGNPADSCPLSSEEDFGWIARMKDVDSQHDKMKKQAFEQKDSSLVLARLDLTTGTLRTTAFPINATTGKAVKWKFKEHGGGEVGPKRALSEEISLVIPGVSGVQIQSTGFGGASSKIALKPSAGSIQAWIINLPILSIVSKLPEEPPKPDHHFHHFYRMATAGGNHIPHPKEDCDEFTGAASNPKCPPAYFTTFEA